jgi:Ser/Thr protein kinase RdoA (MazF antagonist)
MRVGATNLPVTLEGQYSSYSCSSPLAVLIVEFDDGTRRPVVWKDLSPSSAIAGKSAKPVFVCDPRRELLAYHEFLAGSDLGTALCYGVHEDAERGRYWLFLEPVPGVRLPEAADPDAWEATARWLARMHRVLSEKVDAEGAPAEAVRHDATHLWRWMNRAVESTEGSPAEKSVRRLADRFGAAIDRITELPTTMIHGEFYPTNVVVVECHGVVTRICPVDWETLGIGPPLLDLAALTSGQWQTDERLRIVTAYLETSLGRTPESDELALALDALDYCRLYLCVQWIGWSNRWSAPADQIHDWLNEGIELGDRLLVHADAMGIGL